MLIIECQYIIFIKPYYVLFTCEGINRFPSANKIILRYFLTLSNGNEERLKKEEQ